MINVNKKINEEQYQIVLEDKKFGKTSQMVKKSQNQQNFPFENLGHTALNLW